ncbi:MAG: Plasmid stabilization system protein [Candidatus Accumulibacter sp. SK-11]|nr:MAG: Plasmid stabilization system protein [Candidatus Accumulibacter sp. SK-11]
MVWTPEAQQDRVDVWEHIAADKPQAAARMDELFSDAVVELAGYPMLGRPRTLPEHPRTDPA